MASHTDLGTVWHVVARYCCLFLESRLEGRASIDRSRCSPGAAFAAREQATNKFRSSLKIEDKTDRYDTDIPKALSHKVHATSRGMADFGLTIPAAVV